MPSRVNSVKSTSPTSSGSIQLARRTMSPGTVSKAEVLRAACPSRPSEFGGRSGH